MAKSFGKGEVVNRIQDIGLSSAIGPGEAIDMIGKLQIQVRVRTKLRKLKA